MLVILPLDLTGPPRASCTALKPGWGSGVALALVATGAGGKALLGVQAGETESLRPKTNITMFKTFLIKDL